MASILLPAGPPARRPLLPTEQDALLPIHSSLGLNDLWKNLQALFERILPHDTLVMSHGYTDWRRESTTRRLTSAHSRIPDDSHLQPIVAGEGRQFFQPFLDQNLGIPCYHHTELMDNPLRIPETRYYKRFMQPMGWRYSAHLLFWREGEVTTSFALRRRSEQGDFNPAEMALLNTLHPHIGAALERVNTFEGESRARRLLEGYYRAQPDAVLFLDWDLQVIYTSQEATRLCAIWNLGADQARRYSSKAVFALPAEIAGTCEDLKLSLLHEGAEIALNAEPVPRLATTRSPRAACEAAVTLKRDGRGASARPVFVVRLREDPAGSERQTDSRQLLAQLTPAERELAALVCEGLPNKEIAHRLHKTEGSVKVQISGIYHKLRVASRSQLIIALR